MRAHRQRCRRRHPSMQQKLEPEKQTVRRRRMSATTKVIWWRFRRVRYAKRRNRWPWIVSCLRNLISHKNAASYKSACMRVCQWDISILRESIKSEKSTSLTSLCSICIFGCVWSNCLVRPVHIHYIWPSPSRVDLRQSYSLLNLSLKFMCQLCKTE